MSSRFQYPSTASSIAGKRGVGVTRNASAPVLVVAFGYVMVVVSLSGRRLVVSSSHEDDVSTAVPPRLPEHVLSIRPLVLGLSRAQPVRF